MKKAKGTKGMKKAKWKIKKLKGQDSKKLKGQDQKS